MIDDYILYKSRRYQIGIILCILFACAVLAFSLISGSTAIPFKTTLNALLGQSDPTTHAILFNLRLPRIEAAFVTGGLLGLSGCLMQTLLRNPLADPYILGLSGGAAIGTLLCLLAGLSTSLVTAGGWAGSLVIILIVGSLTTTRQDPALILLTGVAIASLAAAIVSLLLITSNDHHLRSMLFWLTGDLSDATTPTASCAILMAGLLVALMLANKMNLFIRGEQEAIALGLATHRLQIQMYLLASLLTATAVSVGGCIGFIGLIIPHAFRHRVGTDHRYLLLGAVLLGGGLLMLADTLARSLFAPIELPVGLMMTLIGSPAFLLLLRQKTRS